jgi:hypothetical protein
MTYTEFEEKFKNEENAVFFVIDFLYQGTIYTSITPPVWRLRGKGCIFCLRASLTATNGCMIR